MVPCSPQAPGAPKGFAMEVFDTYPADYVLITVSTTSGAYLAIRSALARWHRLHAGLLDHGFTRVHAQNNETGTAWAMFSPDLSSAALDDLVCSFEFFFAPAPVAWAYIPAFEASAA